MSLTVVFTTPTTAEALAVPPVAVDIGESLAGAGAVAGEAGGEAVCIGSVVCGLGELVLATGAAAYMTRDHWLPVVKGLFGGASNKSDGVSSWFSVAAALDGPNITYNVVALTGRTDGGYVSIRANCISTATGQVGATSGAFTAIFSPKNDGGSGSYPFCAAGSTVLSAQASFYDKAYNVTASNTVTMTAQVPDSALSQTSTMTCEKPDGTTFTLTQKTTGSAAAGQIVVPSCQANTPGSIPRSINITGGAAGAESSLGTINWPDYKTEYPDCFDASGAYKNTCLVRVWINGEPCVDGMTGCYDPLVYQQDHPGTDVECKWGPYAIAWSNCTPLRHHYGTDPATQTTTVTKVDPKTGDVIVDPTEDDGVDPKAPQPSPSVSIPPQVIPQTGSNPTTDDGVDVSKPQTSSCWGTGWSWNPISWVYIPVKCALSWAFVPTKAPSFTDISSPLPAGWLPSLPDLGTGSCGPITMPKLELGYKGWSVGPVKMLDTCDDPWPLVRDFTYYGLMATTLVTVVWQSFRAVTSGIGMGVSFGGGGGEDA